MIQFLSGRSFSTFFFLVTSFSFGLGGGGGFDTSQSAQTVQLQREKSMVHMVHAVKNIGVLMTR